MGDISTHFNRSEFASRDGAPTPAGMPTTSLVARLEALRCMVGRPLVIRSGYRSPRHNAAVGGASQSQHLEGNAVDLDSGYATVAQAEAAGFTGIGSKGRWATHVDCRDEPARWSY